ncbi:MAG: hypothetical protein LJE62_09190 [Silicimonas sp.]|nr:hypothetical protein [Silicimonas sp.]
MRVLQMIARGIASSMTLVLPRPKAPIVMPEPEPAKLAVEQNDPDQAERRAVANLIACLMLEDEWVEIGDQIARWEAELASTPGGFRFHEIAVDVALSGLQSLIDAAPHKELDDLYEAEVELNCFIETHEQARESHVLAALAARAHLLLGLAYRADHWPDDCRREAWRRMARHYVAAGDILKDYDARALMSPLVAEARYMHGLGSPGQGDRVPELFESWITLDPSNAAIYAAHAVWLADPDKTSDASILAMADAALERTAATLGLGGYALFFQPLLELRPNARRLYDADLYASGMLDLATMSATQAEVNRMADALAGEIRAAGASAPVALRDTLLMLVRNEMTVLYPKLWSISDEAIRGILREASEVLPGISNDDLDRAA